MHNENDKETTLEIVGQESKKDRLTELKEAYVRLNAKLDLVLQRIKERKNGSG